MKVLLLKDMMKIKKSERTGKNIPINLRSVASAEVNANVNACLKFGL